MIFSASFKYFEFGGYVKYFWLLSLAILTDLPGHGTSFNWKQHFANHFLYV